MAGLFTVRNKSNNLETDVYYVSPTSIGGRKTAKFLCYNTRLGTFEWFPADLFVISDSSSGGIDPGQPVSSISFGTDVINGYVGQDVTITATVMPVNATVEEITWTIDEGVATIGTITKTDNVFTAPLTGVSIGTTMLVASAQSGVGAEVEIRIAAPPISVTGIDVLPGSETIAIGQEGSCTGIVSPSNATNKAFTWSVDDPTIIEFTSTAANIQFFSGLKPGTATVTATTVDGSHTGTCVVTISNESTANITTYTELVAAASDPSISSIRLMNSIVILDTVTFSHTVDFDGGGNGVTYEEDEAKDGLVFQGDNTTIHDIYVHMSNGTAQWEGHYGIHIYDSVGVTMSNIRSSGEDGGFLINGSEVAMTGMVNVSDNIFGGIEVSTGSALTRGSVLTVTGATFQNETEAYGSPTIWIDGQGTVNENNQFTIATVEGQQHYYLDPSHAIDPGE